MLSSSGPKARSKHSSCVMKATWARQEHFSSNSHEIGVVEIASRTMDLLEETSDISSNSKTIFCQLTIPLTYVIIVPWTMCLLCQFSLLRIVLKNFLTPTDLSLPLSLLQFLHQDLIFLKHVVLLDLSSIQELSLHPRSDLSKALLLALSNI